MVRVILDKTIEGTRYTLTVPDNATKEDEIEQFTYWIKHYKEATMKVKQARKKLQEVAEEDESVRWLLYVDGFDKVLEKHEEYYLSVATTLLKELVEYASGDELVQFAPLLFAPGLKAVLNSIIKGVQREEEGVE